MFKKVLFTNDDGIDSPSLRAFFDKFKKKFSDSEVFIVAPKNQKSGVSYSISLFEPIEFKQIDSNIYCLDSTPVDCVKVAFHYIFKGEFPDLVISGINLGHNAATSLFYSGTVGAIFESYIHNVNGIAFSYHTKNYNKFSNLERIIDIALEFINDIYIEYPGTYSVNIPDIDEFGYKGFKIMKQSFSRFIEVYEKIHLKTGRDYLYIKDDNYLHEEDSEVKLLEDGYAIFTPLKFDITDYNHPLFK